MNKMHEEERKNEPKRKSCVISDFFLLSWLQRNLELYEPLGIAVVSHCHMLRTWI